MNQEDKIKIFEKYLTVIKTPSIKKFTEFCILNFPDYFWTLNASTSGKQHGGETLVEHVKDCLEMSIQVIRQFKNHWTFHQNDQLISALILHDGWRCGEVGKEKRYTIEDVAKRGYSIDKLGSLRTCSEHAHAGFKQVLLLANEYNSLYEDNQIMEEDLNIISNGIKYHYGPFLKFNSDPFSLTWSYDSVITQVHNIDFHVANNAKMWNNKRKNINL
jgi:hypothetical protein